MQKVKIREVFTYYLPQFHAIHENNKWWGEGFTEWSLLKSAKSLFPGHDIPKVGELGYYSLEDVSVIGKQYQLAKQHSITTFAFWHYWFSDDELLLNRPAELLLSSNVNVKFCFAWANHTWYNKSKGLLLKEQRYDYDVKKHFTYLLPFFMDDRYTKIDNKPVFFIYNPSDASNCHLLMETFNIMAKEHGFDGCFFIAENSDNQIAKHYGFNRFLNSCNFMRDRLLSQKIIDRIKMFLNKKIPLFIRRYEYSKRMQKFVASFDVEHNEIPVAFPRWDSSIRHGRRGVVLTNATPMAFSAHLEQCLLKTIHIPESERFLMIKSWNEWGEGNYIEPCHKYHREFLEVVKSKIEIL